MVDVPGAFFGKRMTSEYHFPERDASILYVLRSISVFSAARLIRRVNKVSDGTRL